MKRYFTLMAIAAMFMSSCVKELAPAGTGNGAKGITEITASYASGETKTVLGEDGTTVLWSPNDEISVFYNGDGMMFKSINSTPKSTAFFVSDGTVLIASSEECSNTPYLYGVYPYDASNAQEGDKITLSVPATQTAVEGSFGRGTYPSVGRSKDTNIAFYNVCGGIRFTLCQEGIRKIVLKGNNNETLAGKVKVQFDESGKPQVSAIFSGEKSVTLTAPDNGEFQTGKWYYISILPTTFSKSGFSVEFIKRTDVSERGSKELTSAVEVKRSVFGSIENIDSNVSFKVDVGSLSISPSKVLVAPMSAAQLSLTILPSGASYKSIKWSSSDKTIATVAEGVIMGMKDGACTITAQSDNGAVAACNVFVCKTPVSTKDANEVSYVDASLDGSFNVIGAMYDSKTAFFLYSDTEPTLEGLKTSGTQVSASLSGSEFSSSLNSLKYNTKYYYVAAATFLGQTYYGEVKNFTSKSLPDGPVDMGLSVKWASVNLGATTPFEYGRYFAWGDVVGQTRYGSRWSGDGFSTWPTCEVDANNNLKLKYDAAHVFLGGYWRMPTHAEQQELIDNCTSVWTNINGVNGRLLTSKKSGYTDKSIFLPAAGFGSNSSLYAAGSFGYYWSGTYYGGNGAWDLDFSSDYVDTFSTSPSSGRSVRPVTE